MTTQLRDDVKYNRFIAEFLALNRSAQHMTLDEGRRLGCEYFLKGAVYEPVYKVEDIKVEGRDKHAIPVRLYRPKEGSLPFLVFFHRGGFVFGSVAEADALCRRLSNHLNCVVASVDYRLAPENSFPIPLNDAYDATVALKAYAKDSPFYVSGESAGGYLAAAVSLLARDNNGPKIDRQILLCPALNAHTDDAAFANSEDKQFMTKETMQFFWSMYLSKPGDDKLPYSSFDTVTNFKNLPPALIITAGYDALRLQAADYAKNLSTNGNEVILKEFPRVIHGFLDLPIYTDEEKVRWIKGIL